MGGNIDEMLDNGRVSRIVSPDSPLCHLRLSLRQSYARRVVVPEKALKARNAQYVTVPAKSSFIRKRSKAPKNLSSCKLRASARCGFTQFPGFESVMAGPVRVLSSQSLSLIELSLPLGLETCTGSFRKSRF